MLILHALDRQVFSDKMWIYKDPRAPCQTGCSSQVPLDQERGFNQNFVDNVVKTTLAQSRGFFVILGKID